MAVCAGLIIIPRKHHQPDWTGESSIAADHAAQ
jgi:hypothetical protein